MLRLSGLKLGVLLLLSVLPSISRADETKMSELVACFNLIKPFTATGAHAMLYPATESVAFIPGKFAEKDGLFFYSDRGASFVAIAPAYLSKTIAFDIDAPQGRLQVIYQPASGSRKPQVWLRKAGGQTGLGVTPVFKNADDAEKRSNLVSELDVMIKGMASTRDTREDQAVQAVEQGKYLWVEVDLDHYKDAVKKCQKKLSDSSETAKLRVSLDSELEALNGRSNKSGTVQDEADRPVFQGAPQY